MMQHNAKQHLFSLLIFAAASCSLANASEQDTDEKAQARQLTELRTTKAQYQNEVKGIKAAYKEALAECRHMQRKERTACDKEAKETYLSDLAEAKRQYDK